MLLKILLPPDDCKARVHLGLQKEEFESQMIKLKGFYDTEISKPKHSEFGQIILTVFPYFYKRMQLAIAENEKSGYAKWALEAKSTNCLCHQDFTASNLILTSSKEIFVLDIDSITIDFPTRDIRKLLNKIMKKKGQWDLNTNITNITMVQCCKSARTLEMASIKGIINFSSPFCRHYEQIL